MIASIPSVKKTWINFSLISERYRSLDRLLSDMALEPPNSSVGDVLATEQR